ncbi:hypothetical protein SKAU_G00012570 [Synaphobranchus kaupii]|uniref:Ras-GEF domain-containing protein n=1 Tax=Synaphobranchus kaupii TaxID=118154 RepID=A0A9Q1GAB2_SYNKA|nr:hypothetical protein SKAU_G00012570 [Synaphobranchus kaupii]
MHFQVLRGDGRGFGKKVRPAEPGGLHLISEVKSEDDRDASTDEFEFSNASFSQSLPVEGPAIFLEPHIASLPTTMTMEEDLSSKTPTPSPLPPPPPHPSSSPRLLSEWRQLMAQLEVQRHEQTRWQQELLGRWLEQEERRQREAADREARRERARMDHELRVLQLLTSLQRPAPCQCALHPPATQLRPAPRDRTRTGGIGPGVGVKPFLPQKHLYCHKSTCPQTYFTFEDNMPQTPPFSSVFGTSGYNKNLYHTSEESYGSLYYHEDNLVSGSLEALIQHLVPNMDYYPDRTYIFTFLLSSRVFIHPHELMSKVCNLCVEHQRLSDPQADKKDGAEDRAAADGEWTETFPYDFRDERMMRSLKELTQRLASGDELYRKAVLQMTQTLIRKLTALSQYEEALAKINATATDRLTVLKTKPQSIQRDILTICNDPFTLAQQLTHIELKDPLDNDKSCFSDHKKASNLEAYVAWFNRLSYLVATEICMPVKKKQRARAIEFFIDVARECFNIGNFNSLMAII